MDIRAAEISKVIKDQIANFGTEAKDRKSTRLNSSHVD